jgi:hypothetical protein
MEGDVSLISGGLLEQATQRERARALAVATTVRLGGAVAFVVLALLLRGAGRPEWNAYLPMLVAYAAIALVFFVLRHRPISPRLAWLSGFIDVGAFYVMQREVLPVATHPAAIASFGLGPFTLLVALSALTLQTRAVVDRAVGRVLLAIDGRGPRSSFIAINQTWDDGWQATLDGAPTALLRTDVDLSGVVVPAGRHQVELVYGDPWVQAGVAVSLAAALACLVLILAHRVRPAGGRSC